MKDSGMTADLGAENVKSKETMAQQWKTAARNVNSLIDFIGSVLFRLRKIVMAVPVLYYALKIALYNREHLPEQVGINLLSSGEFARMITRDMAVMGPLGLTVACVLLMLCSRKAMYPWAISIFTLALPLLILFTNLYPA